jgi:hypothetical protein
MFVPFNLIASQAVSSDLADTLPPSSAQEPNPSNFLIAVVGLNGHEVIESVRDSFSEILKGVLN